MKYILSILLFLNSLLFASISSNDNYQIIQEKQFTIIYTDTYKQEAKFIKNNLNLFLKHNNQSFGFVLDQPITIILISNNIQVPNAFSTQVPYNMSVYFNGGSSMNSYFATKSWLINLLTHETSHNYQLNAKKSKISKTLHKYLGNNYMPIIAGIPFFTLPNLLLPTAFLEGNAVLNESLYNNGGRLYSGRLNALKNSLIFANKITPNSFLNNNLTFPYTQAKYIIGGFYMQYLANQYGLDKVNQFFYAHSIHSINPLLLNTTFKNHFGISFDQSLSNFIYYTKKHYKNYTELNSNNYIAKSKGEIYLSKIDNKIYFITSDLKIKKKLNIFDIDTQSNLSKNTTLSNGKIFKINNILYTNKSDFISNKLYKWGLFDKENYILKQTKGKSIQDIYQNRYAYIDIKKSFMDTKLYINDKFYSNISSNSLFDQNGNIYYFKQNNSKRTFYKNKIMLFTINGFYSKLIETKKNKIYFISNSKNGSTLYMYKNNHIYKFNIYDNIINAKLINKSKALVVTVNSDGYYVKVIDISNPMITSIPVIKNINYKQKFKFNFDINKIILNGKSYNEISNIKFSMLYPSYSYDSTNGDIFMLNGLFVDPIMFNTLNIFAYKDFDTKITGLQYINERYLPFDLTYYKIDRTPKYFYQRDYFLSLKLYANILQQGHNIIKFSIKKYFDDDNIWKKPVITSFNHTYKTKFALNDEFTISSDTTISYKKDREDNIYDINYKFTKHIINELYGKIQLRSINSNVNNLTQQRGIKVSTNIFDIQEDKTNIFIEGNDYNFYSKKVTKYSAGLSYPFYLNHYFTIFPISLQKEKLFITHNNFSINTNHNFKIKEDIFGIKFDLLFFHKLSIPLTIKYIKNDFSKNEHKVKASLGVEF